MQHQIRRSGPNHIDLITCTIGFALRKKGFLGYWDAGVEGDRVVMRTRFGGVGGEIKYISHMTPYPK